jgi:signal transduction histidine kinase
MPRSDHPSSYPNSYSPLAYSSQFIELCRAQLILLSNLGAERGIVYTTQTTMTGQEPKLEPLVAYPDESAGQEEMFISKMLSSTAEDPEMMLSDMVAPQVDISRPSAMQSKTGRNNSPNPQQSMHKWPPQKLLQPLAHEGVIIGLLWVVRLDRPWQEPERHQIEQISRTISLAAIIDQERQWAIQTLQKQQQLQGRQQKLFDNLLHQLRNPLTAIYTFGKLLVKKIPTENANQRIALNILRESEHLKELMQQLDNFTGTRQLAASEDLLLSANVETQNIGVETLHLLPPASLQLQPCSVTDILEPILANAAVVAQEKQLFFSSQIPTDLSLVFASASALREVLGNLVDNALKYTQRGIIQVTVWADEQQLSIVISDSGVGIPAEDLPRLFQRSYRGVQASGDIPGTGLGLSIVKDLLDQMNGNIQVVSPLSYDSQGKAIGSEFTVSLPISSVERHH